MAETVQHAAMPAATDAAHSEAATTPAAAALAALGVVFGDIGTSPLYALKEAAKAAGGRRRAAARGGARRAVADPVGAHPGRHGEVRDPDHARRQPRRGRHHRAAGAAARAAGAPSPGSRRIGVLVLGLVGAALLYGDGVITPAISVLSAVEGLKLDAPQLEPVVVPITVAILIGLFLVQRRGTGFVGAHLRPGHAGLVRGARGCSASAASCGRRACSPRSARSTPWTTCCTPGRGSASRCSAPPSWR